MRTIKTDDRRRDAARRRPAGGARGALHGGHREARAASDLRGHGARDPAPHRADDRRRAPRTTSSESLFLNIVSYENERLGAYMKKLPRRNLTLARVPELPRHPLHVLAGRGARWCCSATAAWSAAAPIPTASACSATRGPRRSRRSGPARRRRTLRRDIERRRLEVLRRLPAQAAARRRTSRRRSAPLDVGAAAVAALHRVHRRLQHLVHPGLLRAGNRHHPHAPGRHARLRSVHARRRRGRPVARPHRLLQLRRGVPAQARASRCASTSSRAIPHIYLYTSTNGLAFTEEQARAAGAIRASTRSPSRSTARRRRATSSTGSAATSTRRSATCARCSTRSAQPAATCRSSTGATSSSRTTTATRRWRWRGRWRPRSASIACAGRSPIIPRTCSRAASRPARRITRASAHEIWDDNNLGNAIPGATPRARIDVGGRVVARPDRRRAAQGGGRPAARDHDARHQPVDRVRSRRRPATAAAWCASARSSAPRDGTLINRDYERAWLPAHLPAGATMEVPITVKAPADARALPAEVRSGERRDRLVRAGGSPRRQADRHPTKSLADRMPDLIVLYSARPGSRLTRPT